MPFAQWLQNKIAQHNFTNYRIAKMAGVHQSTVANWLAGAKPQAEKEKLVRQAISEYEESLLADHTPVNGLIEQEREKHKKIPATMGGEPSQEQLKAVIRNTNDMALLLALSEEITTKMRELM